jgi:hypothetical protein
MGGPQPPVLELYNVEALVKSFSEIDAEKGVLRETLSELNSRQQNIRHQLSVIMTEQGEDNITMGGYVFERCIKVSKVKSKNNSHKKRKM